MAKKDLKAALGASLRTEPNTMTDRVARADSYFETQESISPLPSAKKVIRDGFTIPASEYEGIAQIQAHALQVGLAVTKSEVLRAGLAVLKTMSPSELKQTFLVLEKVKTGRPGKS